MPKQTLRVVSYIRMSSPRQQDSPERQRTQIEAYAKSRGYTIIQVYSDLGMTGDDCERPGFLQLLADAKAGKFDIILIDEPSRLSRTKPSQFIAEVAYPLDKAKVLVESVSAGPLSLEDIGSLILTAVYADRSSSEVKNLSRRVLDGMANRIRASLWLGDPPLGYDVMLLRDKKDPRKVVSRRLILSDPKHVKAVKWMFKEYAAGREGLRSIAREFTRRGIFSRRRGTVGRPITPQGVACMYDSERSVCRRYSVRQVSTRKVQRAGERQSRVSGRQGENARIAMDCRQEHSPRFG